MTTIPENEIIKPLLEKHRNLFHTITTTVPTMDGWATPEKACTLAAVVLQHRPALCVEIGVWAGRSLLPMALALKANGSGKVIGIDPYSAPISAQDEFPDSADWWSAADHEAILKKFQTFIKYWKVEKQVELLRQKSDDVTPPDNIGLLHIDGSHMETAVRDAQRFCPKVVPGGFVMFDDLTWIGGAVLRAMDVAEQLGFRETLRVVNNAGDNWALFRRGTTTGK